MKSISLIALLLTALLTISATLNLGFPGNYANQGHPQYINEDNTPDNNPITDKGAALGRVLFYDKQLSVNNTVACASCHKQQFAFGDNVSASQGVNGTTGRHSMRLVNARFADEDRFFWDERANSLEQHTTMPVKGHTEMRYSGQNGDPGFSVLINKMNGISYYPQLFNWVFGDNNITEQRMQFALAQFVRSIQSFDSKYDVGRALVNNDNDPFPNFTREENDGKRLFMRNPQFNNQGVRTGGGAGCDNCHRAPEFDIRPNSRNNGITGSFGGGTDVNVERSPTLRDIVDANGNPHGGFMHNAGQNGLNSLRDVINHYNSIPQNNNNLDNRLRPNGNLQRLNLSEEEKLSLVAFIRTLTGSNIYTDPRWSDPFANGGLTLVPGATGIVLNAGEEKVNVYPTVSSDMVHINYPASMRGSNMYLLSLSGKVMYKGIINSGLNISAYPAGMYLLKFDNSETVKIIKR